MASSQQPTLPRKQPIVEFFDISVGGVSNIHTKSAGSRLNYPVSFSFKHELGGYGEVSMVLNDPTGKQVERQLINTDIPSGWVQFGYEVGEDTSDLKSPRIPFYIDKLVPVWMDNHYNVVVGGKVFGYILCQTGQASGTFKENIDALEKKYKNQIPEFRGIVIDPPVDVSKMQELGSFDVDTTEKQEFQFTKLASEPDWNFIQRICKYGRDAEGNSGYVIKPKMTDDGGVELHITIPTKSSDRKRYKYTYPSREGNVVKDGWLPDTDYVAFVRGAVQQHNGYEDISGNMKKHVIDRTSAKDATPFDFKMQTPPPVQEAIKNKDLTIDSDQGQRDANQNTKYIGSIGNPPDINNSATRSRPIPTTTSMAGINPLLHSNVYNQILQMTATLILVGDPTLEPGMEIDVQAYYPNNYDSESGDGTEPHYTTGTYLLMSVNHQVGVSQPFISTCSLMRISPLGELNP